MIDFAEFDALIEAQERGLAVELVHPVTQKPLGVTIRVAGPDSKRRRDSENKIAQRRIERRQLGPVTEDERREENELMLAMCTMEWYTDGEPHVIVKGAKVPFSTEAVAAFYKRFPFVYEQVGNRAQDRSGFMPG